MSTISEHYDKGVLAKQEGRYAEAAAALAVCLEIDPDHAEAHWQMGLVQCFIGDFDMSIAELKQGVSLDANNIKIRNDLAMTLLMLGEMEEAKHHFEVVLALDPENSVASKQMAYF